MKRVSHAFLLCAFLFGCKAQINGSHLSANDPFSVIDGLIAEAEGKITSVSSQASNIQNVDPSASDDPGYPTDQQVNDPSLATSSDEYPTQDIANDTTPSYQPVDDSSEWSSDQQGQGVAEYGSLNLLGDEEHEQYEQAESDDYDSSYEDASVVQLESAIRGIISSIDAVDRGVDSVQSVYSDDGLSLTNNTKKANSSSSQATVNSLLSQIKSLEAQIASIKQQVNALRSGTSRPQKAKGTTTVKGKNGNTSNGNGNTAAAAGSCKKGSAVYQNRSWISYGTYREVCENGTWVRKDDIGKNTNSSKTSNSKTNSKTNSSQSTSSSKQNTSNLSSSAAGSCSIGSAVYQNKSWIDRGTHKEVCQNGSWVVVNK